MHPTYEYREQMLTDVKGEINTNTRIVGEL